MKFTDLTVLLPCHSLEDFPIYQDGQVADELLSAWCALWHPALLASAGALPGWHRVDVPPETLGCRLVTLPQFCHDRVPAGFDQRVKNEGGWLVQESGLDAAVTAALAGLNGGRASVDEELARDFLALGFCRLQIELLTRQMRYSMNVDETHFQNEAVAAAQAAMAGQVETARGHLQQCFDTLYQSRKHYYPVDVYLLDLTLAAGSTLGDVLRRELAGATPINLCLPTATLRQLHDEQPETWTQLLDAIDHGRACVTGGETQERELPLLPLERSLASLAEGVRDYETLLGRRPQIYSRRRAGLWPALPQLLVKLAYKAALHFTLDDGRFPVGSQGKTRWEGIDSSVIDIWARVPADAARADTYLGLSRSLADSMDNDHVATVALAHWPSAASPWHAMLRRVASLSPVLGNFSLLDDYFSHTDMPGRLTRFEPDQYRTPYLKQAVDSGQTDPISQFVLAHRQQAARAAREAIATLADLVSGKVASPACAERAAEHCTESKGEFDSAIERLARTLPRAGGAAAPGYLVVNPLSFARRVAVEVERLDNLPAVGGPVAAAGMAGQRKLALVDVPAMGFARVVAAATPPAPSRAKPIGKENALRNEFFEVTVSRSTGGIQSVYDFGQRGNQLSQQLALRTPAPPLEPGAPWRDPDSAAIYSTMRAESVELTASSLAMGEITSRGTLVGEAGRELARFRQTVQVWAGSRIVRVDLEFETFDQPTADPWNSYYAARFAWPDESADLWRGVGLTRHKTEAARIEAPEYLEIETGAGTLTIFTGGLPYHRKSDPRMLDTLLVVRGEACRKFQLGIGVGISQPAAAALDWITPPAASFDAAPPLASASGWLFHVDAKNVVATHWSPILDEQERSSDAGSIAVPREARGFRARLLETAGRAGRVHLRAFRPVGAARQVDFLGETMVEARVEGDKIMLDFAANEWIEIEALWRQ